MKNVFFKIIDNQMILFFLAIQQYVICYAICFIFLVAILVRTARMETTSKVLSNPRKGKVWEKGSC